ncbi:hypothetical protein D0T51_12030 [Parabacteroides sp. 52]|uniref:hypothetical protein n=1 Tax=unclassified Parabacteroides TaxID=2649774 RepID=UPI0013D25CDE|nr:MULTISPECIES: hypothetical protein [unclassified Parabacteroides]MDH6535618.1 hypothetical protein [Parabacteroides sp. PM5-20]NDV56448.1 hypothetical protein [Parabacteroides sp. 52]
MNNLQLFLSNFIHECIKKGVEYDLLRDIELDNGFRKRGFSLKNRSLGFYHVHLLIDENSYLQGIRLLGNDKLSQIAEKIEHSNEFYGIPAQLTMLDVERYPSSLNVFCEAIGHYDPEHIQSVILDAYKLTLEDENKAEEMFQFYFKYVDFFKESRDYKCKPLIRYTYIPFCIQNGKIDEAKKQINEALSEVDDNYLYASGLDGNLLRQEILKYHTKCISQE